MSSIAWVPGLALPIGDATLDYTFNFATWLESDTIATATVEGTGLTASAGTPTATAVVVRVSAAEANSKLVLTITTVTGQSQSFATYFNPEPSTCCAS
jgi:hypothetical protein